MGRFWPLLALLVAVVAVSGCGRSVLVNDPSALRPMAVRTVGMAFAVQARPVLHELLRVDAFLRSVTPGRGRAHPGLRGRLATVRADLGRVFRVAEIHPVGAAEVHADRLLSDIGWREVEVATLDLAGQFGHAAAFERSAESAIRRARAALGSGFGVS